MFDFGSVSVTKILATEMPKIMKNRLVPPPREVYALHRKLLGTYVMCLKLEATFKSKEMFK